ncbi:Fur family transcriptional regulator [Pedococcus sp. 5OH_020]|uniref:Fur family transcriptional regulator n=1 Tax=Pedococcus sp. 5OH_020 TaxID=2989814 RepID=UPI0022E9D7C0|nr:Fur family transcriptional regulator [Pedococcus sp. 5OH_020]
MRAPLQDRLRSAGLRVTRPRLTTLEVLDEAQARQEHLPVADVAGRVRGLLGSVSTQAVYDCLEALAGAGLVRRIEPAGHPARYESRVGDNHHHLVCRDCGATVDVDCAVGHAPCLSPTSAEGFLVDEAEVVYWGRCPGCATSATLTL